MVYTAFFKLGNIDITVFHDVGKFWLKFKFFSAISESSFAEDIEFVFQTN